MCTWGWTLAQKQKHQILDSQNYLVLKRKCSSNFSISHHTFLTWKKIKHSWNLFPFLFIKDRRRRGEEGVVDFLKFSRDVGLRFPITNSFQCYLSVSVWCVCVCVCVFIYPISISNIYVSQEETSLIASNQ